MPPLNRTLKTPQMLNEALKTGAATGTNYWVCPATSRVTFRRNGSW
jgi:hypothetical protein